MIRSIVREHHWTLKEITEMFHDDQDYHGLIYWYNDILEMHKELEKK